MAIFYEKGKSVSCFLQKEQFRAQLSRKVVSLKAPKETFRQVTFFVVTMIENLYKNQEDYVRYPRRIVKGHKRPVSVFGHTITGQCSRRQKSQSWFCHLVLEARKREGQSGNFENFKKRGKP